VTGSSTGSVQLAEGSKPSIWTENETYYEYGKWATSWFGPKHSVQADDVRLFPAVANHRTNRGKRILQRNEAANEINQSNYRGTL
jgi:hypothetical protein